MEKDLRLSEQRALEAYPEDIQLFVESQEESGKWLPVDENFQLRYGYKRGYEQAEKDLELTWEDVQLLDNFVLELVREEKEGKDWGNGKEFYTEVLKRFKEAEENTKTK